MTLLTVWPDADPSTELVTTDDPDEIAEILAGLGVRFARWRVVPLSAHPTSDEVLTAYRSEVDGVIAAEGYTFVDAVAMTPEDSPEWREEAARARAKFLSEHTHDDDEDRFFARGSGIFYLHVDGKVHAVLCEAGDLLSVPAKTTHWFDMGTNPDYVSIRFFHDDDGWVADFLADSVAHRFPTYDEITAGR
jgi:1,2-dihydroxy-3-keto-5-methylthiopentene dioxygenase